MIHQLIGQIGSGGGLSPRPPFTVVARCGHSEQRIRPSDPMPEGFSGWDSLVTCPECRRPSLSLAALDVFRPKR